VSLWLSFLLLKAALIWLAWLVTIQDLRRANVFPISADKVHVWALPKDGGQAFPCPADDKSGWSAEYGMTLRDWFAGKATDGDVGSIPSSGYAEGFGWREFTRAERRYMFADAMLAAREGEKP